MIWLFLILVVVVLIIVYNNNSESFRGRGRGRGRGRRHRRFGRGGYGRPRQRRGWMPFWWSWRGNCPNGCTAIGNDGWGCQYPGYGSNDCIFAEDCKFCGGGSRWWW